MDAFQVIKSHETKTIECVEQVGKHIVIKFFDGTKLTLLEQGCNTCGGYNVEGSDN